MDFIHMKNELGRVFQIDSFKKSFKLTWLFVASGQIVFIIFYILAMNIAKGNYFFYFLQNTGIFFLFVILLMAYTGVYIITRFPAGENRVTRQAIGAALKKSHYVFGISLAAGILVTVIVLIEVGISSLGFIPYAGPPLVALLTAPMFLVNITCLFFMVCFFALVPPMIAEASSFGGIVREFRTVFRERWLSVLMYLIISLSILILSALIIYYLVRYSVGITMAAQWKLNAVYPGAIKSLASESYLTELVNYITPIPETLTYFKFNFGSGWMLNSLTYFIGLSYLLGLSLVISLPLAAYFNISSLYFYGMWKGDKPEGSR